MVQLSSAPCSLRVVVIYRPPQASAAEFIEQFNSLLEETCLGGSPIILAGDLNIHMDNKDQTLTLRYNELLYAVGLTQHVEEPTHTRRHILDHIISRNSDNIAVKDVTMEISSLTTIQFRAFNRE